MKSKNLYILNVPIVVLDQTVSSVKATISRFPIEDLSELIDRYLKEGRQLFSAVGHKATAELLNHLDSRIPATPNRVQIFFKEGDVAIAFKIRTRLPEGVVLETVEDLEEYGYDLYLIKIE